MKKAIINIGVLILLISSLQITVIATAKKNYSFDELIIEKAVTSPYLAEENKYSEGLAIKEAKYNTGEYINIPGEGNIVVPFIYDCVGYF